MSLYDDASRRWNALTLAPRALDLPRFQEWCDRLAGEYRNGRVVFKTYDTGGLGGGERGSALHEFSYLLKSRLPVHPIVARDFAPCVADDRVNREQVFGEMHPYELPGMLAVTLQSGGAYSPDVAQPGMMAFTIAMAAALEIAGGDLNRIRVWSCGLAWSSFFRDVAWDVTLVILRPDDGLLALVMATDED
jgi:hypothetical protein